MVRRLFPDFLENPESYKASELVWTRAAREVAASMHQEQEWQRWIPRHFANGTPMEPDGNPIYDARNDRLKRAFRILQHPPFSQDLELVGWISSAEAEYDQLPNSELVLNLSLSEESLAAAREILGKWMAPETTPESMRSYLAEKYPPKRAEGTE